MPVLYNNQTGDYEDQSPDVAHDLVASGSHLVPMNDPDGQAVNVPYAEMTKWMGQGYTQPTPEQLNSRLSVTKYSQPGEEAKAFGRGAASAFLPFGASQLAEQAVFGTTPKEQLASEQNNPGWTNLGQAAGIGLSVGLGGLGAPGYLSEAGDLASGLTGLGGQGSNILSKVGSAAVRGAVETGIIQSSDEAAKLFMQDPSQHAETALQNIGLASALGGAIMAPFGAVSPLWEATQKSALGKYLNSFIGRANGEVPPPGSMPGMPEGMPPLPPDEPPPGAPPGMPPIPPGALGSRLQNAIAHSGLDIPPAIQAALGNDPVARDLFATLMHGDSSSAKETIANLSKFNQDAHDAILGALGKTPMQAEAISNASDFEKGSVLKDALSDEISQTVDPASRQFEAIKQQYAGVKLTDLDKSQIANEMAKFSDDTGLGLLKGSEAGNLMNRTVKSLMDPAVSTLEDLRKLQSQVLSEAAQKQQWKLSSGFKNIFRNAEDSVVQNALNQEIQLGGVNAKGSVLGKLFDWMGIPNGSALPEHGPSPEAFSREQSNALIARHAEARAAWRDAMSSLDSLDYRLRLGNYSGPTGFLHNLGELKPEEILKRLTPKNDAGLLEFLSNKFPNTAQAVKNAYLDQIIKPANRKAAADLALHPKTVFGIINSWSPELKKFVLAPGSEQRIQAIQFLMDSVPKNMNPSGTAKTLNKLWASAPGGAAALLAGVIGENPYLGFIIGQMGKFAQNESKDAVRLSALKVLASDAPVNAVGFKNMADYITQGIKGEELISKGAQAVYNRDKEVPVKQVDQKSRDKLDRKVSSIQEDPTSLLNMGNQLGHYLPEHNTALASAVSRSVQYLSSVKPKPVQLGPLDPKLEPSEFESEAYNRALDIAISPNIVFQAVRDGTLIQSDMRSLTSMYPNLYSRMAQKLTEQMIEHIDSGDEIPYSTRLSLSLFLGKDLDSTMTTAGIQGAQPGPTHAGPLPTQLKPSNASMAQMGKVNQLYQLPSAARESDKLLNHS